MGVQTDDRFADFTFRFGEDYEHIRQKLLKEQEQPVPQKILFKHE